MFATLRHGGFGTHFVYRLFRFTMVVFACFFVPETKGELRPIYTMIQLTTPTGLALEDMDELFSQSNVRAPLTPNCVARSEAERLAKGKLMCLPNRVYLI